MMKNDNPKKNERRNTIRPPMGKIEFRKQLAGEKQMENPDKEGVQDCTYTIHTEYAWKTTQEANTKATQNTQLPNDNNIDPELLSPSNSNISIKAGVSPAILI